MKQWLHACMCAQTYSLSAHTVWRSISDYRSKLPRADQSACTCIYICIRVYTRIYTHICEHMIGRIMRVVITYTRRVHACTRVYIIQFVYRTARGRVLIACMDMHFCTYTHIVMHMHAYTYTHRLRTYVPIYIYIYTYRKHADRFMYIYIYMHTCMDVCCVYVHVYVYYNIGRSAPHAANN